MKAFQVGTLSHVDLLVLGARLRRSCRDAGGHGEDEGGDSTHFGGSGVVKGI